VRIIFANRGNIIGEFGFIVIAVPIRVIIESAKITAYIEKKK
jgi:hypothetical protein